VIVGIIQRKPVLTYASIIFGDMLASVNSVNFEHRCAVFLATFAYDVCFAKNTSTLV